MKHLSDSVRFFVAAMKHKRQLLGLTQQQLAVRSGVSLVTINQIEGLKRADPDVSTLENIASALEYKVDELILEGRRMSGDRAEMFRRVLGHVLRQARENRSLTKSTLAHRIGMSPTHLSNIEQGINSPTIDKVVNVCDALGVGIDEVFLAVIAKLDKKDVDNDH